MTLMLNLLILVIVMWRINMASVPTELATIEDVLRVKAKMPKGWMNLFGFCGNAEGETMIASNIYSCASNYEKTGVVFSYKGGNIEMGRQQDGTDNSRGYSQLLAEGYFVEGEHEGKVTVLPTKRLIQRLDAYFEREERESA
jgi:hypothetical protein